MSFVGRAKQICISLYQYFPISEPPRHPAVKNQSYIYRVDQKVNQSFYSYDIVRKKDSDFTGIIFMKTSM